MSDQWMYAATLVTALGCGLVAGVFFAFSTFVMQGLARTPPAHGISAMQSINVQALTPLFMTLLFGTGAAVGLLAVAALASRPAAQSMHVVAAAFLYLVGVVGVTGACNVPRNNRLMEVHPESAEGSRVWADYVVSWTAWNHVRTITALAAAAALCLAL